MLPSGLDPLEPAAGLAPDAFPGAPIGCDGVSVGNTLVESPRWFVLRATYNRQQRAHDFLAADGAEVYMPVRRVVKLVAGRRKRVVEPLVPSLLFVHATPCSVAAYVNDTPELSFLTFYYDHFHANPYGKNPPLTVSDAEMANFIRLTSVDSDHIRLVAPGKVRYRRSDLVRITEGDFAGVVGRVARVDGQQRVLVELRGVCIVATAYVPTAFLEHAGEAV